MNHKILEQTKGGAFLAGDLPMSTSSYYYYYNNIYNCNYNHNNNNYYHLCLLWSKFYIHTLYY
jgi:hypothetical protein